MAVCSSRAAGQIIDFRIVADSRSSKLVCRNMKFTRFVRTLIAILLLHNIQQAFASTLTRLPLNGITEVICMSGDDLSWTVVDDDKSSAWLRRVETSGTTTITQLPNTFVYDSCKLFSNSSSGLYFLFAHAFNSSSAQYDAGTVISVNATSGRLSVPYNASTYCSSCAIVDMLATTIVYGKLSENQPYGIYSMAAPAAPALLMDTSECTENADARAWRLTYQPIAAGTIAFNGSILATLDNKYSSIWTNKSSNACVREWIIWEEWLHDQVSTVRFASSASSQVYISSNAVSLQSIANFEQSLVPLFENGPLWRLSRNFAGFDATYQPNSKFYFSTYQPGSDQKPINSAGALWLMEFEPCRNLVPPSYGSLGDCYQSIPSFYACNMHCDEGSPTIDLTTCFDGLLSMQRCTTPSNDCDFVKPPAHGSMGTCDSWLFDGDSCVMQCDEGYSLSLATTTCDNGVLHPQMCTGSGPQNRLLSILIGSIGSIVGVTLALVGLYWKKANDRRKRRQRRPMAAVLFHHLPLIDADDFDSPTGTEFIAAVDLLARIIVETYPQQSANVLITSSQLTDDDRDYFARIIRRHALECKLDMTHVSVPCECIRICGCYHPVAGGLVTDFADPDFLHALVHSFRLSMPHISKVFAQIAHRKSMRYDNANVQLDESVDSVSAPLLAIEADRRMDRRRQDDSIIDDLGRHSELDTPLLPATQC